MKHEMKEKLWTPSFFILWQGQLVSTIGDAVYSIALGFWVLAATGSTALMGTLMAASTLPGVLVSPFAGVLIDRCNKKRLFILMDMIRGLCIVLVSAAAYKGMLAVWMVFVAGVLLSICGAVFSPGIQSTVPDLVPKSKLENANSVFSIVSAGSNMIGNVAGGFLFQMLGAPVLFLFDGLSFLFSGASIPFVKIPKNVHNEKLHFFEDMSGGFRYMWRQKGLRMILILAAVMNFFSFIGIVLLLPFCQTTPSLGAGKYGVLMGSFMIGAMAGFVLLSAVSVKPGNKMKLYILSNIISDLSIIVAINQPSFIAMALLLVLSGFFNSVVNVLLIATVQASTPPEVRGKVMAFMSMTTQGLTPFAMALGGVLGEILPIRLVISLAFTAVLLSTALSFFAKPFIRYLTTDYSRQDAGNSMQEGYVPENEAEEDV